MVYEGDLAIGVHHKACRGGSSVAEQDIGKGTPS